MKATTDTREVPQAQQPTITPLRSVTSQPKQLQQESEIEDDNTNSKSGLDTRNEKNDKYLKEAPILYYASKAGLLPENYQQDQDLILTKGYVYNQKNNTLRRHDSAGTRYYNKNDEETRREKFLLIYELKKLYLEKEEKEQTQKLQKGEFYDNNLVVEDNSSQKKSLEEKVKYIDKIIDILNEQNPNYGRSFGEQVNNFIRVSQDFKHLLNDFSDIEWNEQVVKFTQSLLESTRFSESAEVENVIDLNKEKQRKCITQCINIAQSKDFEIEIEQLKNSQEYRELSKTKSEEFVGGLIRDIKHKSLVIRKEQIERELNKTKFIEEEIRKKQDEIRKTQEGFREEYQISQEDEKRYERLLKAQQLTTNQEYRYGLSKTKEKTEEDKLKSGIRHCKYDEVCEVKDVKDITQTINKEYSRIKTKEEDIANKEQEAVNLREDRIPTLEEERDLLQVIIEKLKSKLDQLSKQTKKYQDLEQQEHKNITKIEADNGRYEVEIKAQYQKLSNVLTNIEELKTDIGELKIAKNAVRGEEESAFKERIFDQVGGQRSGNYSPDGYCNHKSCPATLPGETKCQYKNAVKDAVSCSISKFPSLVSKEELLEHLSGYKHSAVGDARHQEDLLMIPKHVYDSYKEVQNIIKKREDEYQAQITENERKQQIKEKERDDLREKIIIKENELNDSNIAFSTAEREKEKLIRQRDENDKQITLINYYIETTNTLQSSVIEEIDKKEEEISELIHNITDKTEEINEVEAKINKEGEYNQVLALSEVRWRYSQYEKIITNIGSLEKQKKEQERLEQEKNVINEKLESNLVKKKTLNSSLKTKKTEIEKSLTTIEELVHKKNDLIAERSLLERNSQIGLVNTIESCRKEVKSIEKQQESAIKEVNKARAEIIRREIYKTLPIMSKGTTKNDEDSLEDVGTANQLYKKRRYKKCQDVFNKDSQTCKYFDALDIIIKILLETDSKSSNEIFTKLESKGDNYKNHVLLTHKTDLENSIKIIKDKITEFNQKIKEIEVKYTNEQKPINKHITDAKEQLAQKKKLDGMIIVKNLASRTEEQDKKNVQDNLDAGVDCVVIEQKEIYTSKKSKMNINEFIKEITSGYDLPMDLTSEVKKLLDSRKAVSIEAVLLQKKDTNQKKLYKLLVHYFDKTYLKKKLEIVEQLNNQAVLEGNTRNIRREIERIDRENEQLRWMQTNLEHVLDPNAQEIEILSLVGQELVPLIATIRGEIKDFERMRALCVELLEMAKQENEEKTKKIKSDAQEIKDLKGPNKIVDLSVDSLYDIKPKILKNRLKIGLQTELQTRINKHRDCIGDDSCDFYQQVVTLIDNTIQEIQNNKITLRAPEYKVSTDNQNRLIEQLKINEGHSKKHEKALKRIVAYVATEYGQEREKALIRHQTEIKTLEWKIAKIEFTKDASTQILIPELEKRIEEINKFLTFSKDMSFVDEHSVKEDTSQKELSEYKEEKFKALFKHQMDDLISCMKLVSSRIKLRDIDKEFLIQDEAIRSITKFSLDVFKEYYDDLNIVNFSIDTLILKLEQELSEEHQESRIKALMKKKTTKMGGTEYLLKKISWIFQQNREEYNELLDPEKIYYKILLAESQKKEKIEEASLEVLQKELSDLEIQKKELSIQDNFLLREELENINTCVRYIENTREVANLRNRIEEIDDSRSNKDDYYSFDMDSRRICVRLLNTDPIEKSVEIKEIDRIRNYITEHSSKLLEQKVLKEVYSQELKDEVEKEFKGSFIAIQRKLLVKGISLCGYDTFDNGEPLDKINGFISVIIGVLIGENSLYQIGSINEASRRVGEWTRKIRLKYNEFRLSKEVTEQEQVWFITNAVNKEFNSDNLFINQIIIIKNQQNKTISFGVQQHQQSITLLMHEAKRFVLVPRDKIKVYKDDIQIDVSMRITHILAVLQTEEDLFKYLCHRRLQDILRVTLEHSKKLAEDYKREKSNLAKISSLKDFNALFCNMLELTDIPGSSSVFLFAYLAYLEKLENSITNDDSQEKIARLKIVKNLYDKALFTIIKAEQQRRQKKNVTQFKESREELYLKELIKDREGEIAVLLQEINKQEENIEKDQNVVNSLLFEKENTRDQYQEKIEQLSNITIDLKAKLKSTQERIRELNKNQEENQEQIKETQAAIVRLETALAEVEKEKKLKEHDKEALEIEITNLKGRKEELGSDLKRVNAEKERKEQEEAEKKKEIEVGKDIVQLIQNLQLILTTAKLQSKKEEIKKSIYISNNLSALLKELRKELEVLVVDETNFWQQLIVGINYEQLQEYLNSDKKIAGELQHNLVNRLRAVIRDAVNIECEIVQELVKGKPIKRFKVLATNVNYQEIHSKVKEYVEKELHSTEASRGLNFKGDVLYSTEYGITGIKDLPSELRILIERRIELHYRSEEVESKKNAKFTEAVKIINELNIDYKDIVKCYVDEIEIIASSRFILNDSPSYPGIDLTINAVDMECVGENLTLDTSGKSGAKFCYDASDGRNKRSNGQPRGDKGYDGYDGEHGDHAGNIVIKVENAIKNLQALTSIKANGGNGGKGQLGGNGDEGLKGRDGKNGEAADTKGLGGGQTTIGFGSPGIPGGRGGAPGNTGRPGLGGKEGVIDITPKVGKITWGEINPGQDADNILDKLKPSGGDGGEPGLYGMDQVRDKKSFFNKTKTFYTVIDRAALIEKHPKFRDQIIASENITSTNRGALAGLTLSLVVPVVAIPAALLLVLTSSRVSYEEGNNSTDYRNRGRNLKNKRGRKNEEEASLRSDYRTPQQDKRVAINIDSLYSKLNEKKKEEKEITGEVQHKENIYDLIVEQEEIVGDIEKCTQEASNIQGEMENIGLAIETKDLELEKIRGDIASLQNKELALDSERLNKINQVIKAITESQNLRDKKGELGLDMEQALAKLAKYNVLGEEFCGNKEDLIRIIDEYLEAVRARLKSNRYDLKFLKKNFVAKELDIKILSKKLEDLHQERLAQIVTEAEIDQEIEEEAETQHVEEITNVIDLEDRKVYLKAKYDNKQQINEDSYVVTIEELLVECIRIVSFNAQDQNVSENISDIEFILKQTVRHYRSGVYNELKVESIIEEIRKKSEQASFIKGDLKKIIETYKKEINKIRTINNIDTLSTIERNLILDHLKKINIRLEIDHLANLTDDKAIEAFVLKMMKVIDKDEEQEHNIAKKLQIRFDGQHLLGNDKLKDDIETLIGLIEDRKTFYLEKCAINFTPKSTVQTECEKTMLAYNQQPSLENLVSLVRQFKTQLSSMEGENQENQFDTEYLPKSVEGFISAVVENIRYHGILVLNNIIENESRNNKGSNELQQENLVEQMESIRNNIKDLKTIHVVISKITALTQIIEKIIEILALFSEAVKKLKDGMKSKKEANRAIKSLEAVTKKLIKYIDIGSDNKFSQVMEQVANDYLIATKSALDIEGVQDISEQLDLEEERVISRSTRQEQHDDTIAGSSTQSAQIIETLSNSGLQGVGLRQAASIGWINAYFGEYTLNAIEHILALRINNAGLEEIIIAKGYVFQENYNNLQRMISDLTDTKSRIILAPLNLYNKHAAGIMGIKDQDNELQLYYIDPSNETIPDKLKQIFVDHDLQIVQLPARQQEYANCGPEVIENFMLYLTGERLSQEESIAYHSKLVEQKLVSKDNTLVEVMDSDINNQELPKDLYDNPEQEEVRVESKDVTIEALASTSYPMKYLAPISLTTEDTKLFKQDKDLNTNRSNNPSKNDVTREQKAFFAYSQGNILSNEAWEAESDELNDRSVEAEQKFAASLKLYEEAVKLSPTNIVYKHALDITSLKIEGNNLFSEGIVLASIAYGLQEEANALAVDQEAYEEILGKYQQALGAYKAAQDSFHVGWNLSKDVRFKSCIEIVQDAIELIQEHIEEIQGEMDSASIPKNDIVGTENYLTIGPIELFKQEKQDYILNDYLIGNSQELFYM
ncbi:hypothetical protein [Candidatus Tisiphia endosymbiont of Nemotelus uliginosus]|uniref:hypothetical protein n=1 Tax=Candidatus Tisiphia endosymbiont of Nemotelus uliginosus TaxID=3077926 RepID=UPI0035C90123